MQTYLLDNYSNGAIAFVFDDGAKIDTMRGPAEQVLSQLQTKYPNAKPSNPERVARLRRKYVAQHIDD